MKNIILLLAFSLCCTGTTNAQFLKKLGKKIEKAAEKTVEKKAEQKTKKETEKVFDSTFNKEKEDKTEQQKKKKRTFGMPSLASVAPADAYNFDHKVEMRMISGKDEIDIDYYIASSGNYLGTQPKDKKMKGEFITVFDIEREAMFNFMKNDGEKMMIGVNFETIDEETEDATYEIIATGNSKKILGYNCLEYKMTGKDMTATLWVTKEVDIRFPSTYHKIKQKKKNQQEWMHEVDGFTMEMVMIDSSKRKDRTIKMNCLSIGKTDFKIESKDYKSM